LKGKDSWGRDKEKKVYKSKARVLGESTNDFWAPPHYSAERGMRHPLVSKMKMKRERGSWSATSNMKGETFRFPLLPFATVR